MSGQAAGHAGAFLRVLVLRAAELRPRRTDVLAVGALPARLLPRPGLAQLHLPLLHSDHRSRGAPRRLRDGARDPGARPADVSGRMDPDDQSGRVLCRETGVPYVWFVVVAGSFIYKYQENH